MLVVGLAIVRRKSAARFLCFTPDGIYASANVDFRVQSQPIQVRWDSVIDVLDFIPWRDSANGRFGAYQPLCPLVFVMRDRSLQVIDDVSAYLPGNFALFWMARTYWKYPELRAELANGIAARRLVAEQYPCV